MMKTTKRGLEEKGKDDTFWANRKKKEERRNKWKKRERQGKGKKLENKRGIGEKKKWMKKKFKKKVRKM